MQRFQRLPLVQLPLFNQIHQLKMHLCLVGCCNLCQFLAQVAQRFFVTVEVVTAVITGKQVHVAPLRRLTGHPLRFGQLLIHIFAYGMVELADFFNTSSTDTSS